MMRSQWGLAALNIDREASSVKAGDELAISRLRPGKDEIFITPHAGTQLAEM